MAQSWPRRSFYLSDDHCRGELGQEPNDNPKNGSAAHLQARMMRRSAELWRWTAKGIAAHNAQQQSSNTDGVLENPKQLR